MTIIGEVYKIEADDGLIYELHDGETRFVVNTIDSAGLPPVEYLTRRPYRADRLIETGYRLNPRNFAISYQFINDCSREVYWEARAALLNVVRPNRGEALTVTLIRDDGVKRAIKARALTPVYPSVDVNSVDEWSFAEILQFDAFDPTFFDPTASMQVVSYNPIQELAFPIEFDEDDIYFGSGAIFGTLAITYLGTWYSYPTFTITPPFDSIRVNHNELGVNLQLLYGSSTRTVTIDLNTPAITDDLGISLFNYLSPDSDLQGFKLQPDPIVDGGINTLIFTIPGATDPQTTVGVDYLNRYIGI